MTKFSLNEFLFSVLLIIVAIVTIGSIVIFAISCDEEDDSKCVFNETNWSKNNASTLFAAILTGSAAILAISFIITEVVITNISKNYSSHLLNSYLKKTTTHAVFYGWITIATISAAFLFFLSVMNLFTTFLSMIILFDGFILALALFIKHYHHMIRVVNPFTIIDELGDQAILNFSESE